MSGPATIDGDTITITGVGTVVVRASQAGDNNYVAAADVDQSFTVSTAPVVTIDSQPSLIINTNSTTILFHVDGDYTGVTCDLDGNVFTPCTSPAELTTLDDGSHTFTITATDALSNSSSKSATFTVDTIKPVVALGTLDNPTSSKTPAIPFTVTDASSYTSECNVDETGFVSCDSPYTTPELTDGLHTITVRATDIAGNVSDTMLVSFTVDTTAPQTTITNQPANFIGTTSATIEFNSDDASAALTCKLDSADFADCTSPVNLDSLTEGAHTFTVKATDELGHYTTASADFTVDLTAPEIDLKGDNPMTVALDGNYTEPGATVTDNLDPNPTLTISSSTVDTAHLGVYQVTYDAVDAAGNQATQVIRTVNVTDQTKPVITLIGSSTLPVAIGATFTDPGATASDNVDGDLTSQIKVSGDTVDTATAGTYYIYYDVSDAAGNAAIQVIRTVVVSNLQIETEQNTGATTNSVTITWTTSHPASSRVLWDTVSHTTASSTEAGPANYGYANSTSEDSTLVTAHSVTVSGLTAGTTYYFRPVSHGSPETLGDEVAITTQTPPASGGGGGGGGGSYTAPVITVKATSTSGTATTTSVTTGGVKVLGIESPVMSTLANLYGVDSNTVEIVTSDEASHVMTCTDAGNLTTSNQKIYDKIIKNYSTSLSDAQKLAIKCFVQNGTQTTMRLGAGERGGVINSFATVFSKLPTATVDWQDIVKIANGRWPSQRNASYEVKMKTIFVKIYGRKPNLKNAADNSAIAIMAYGLLPVNRNTNSEKAAIKTFKAIYHYSPTSALDWNITRAIAYSGAKR